MSLSANQEREEMERKRLVWRVEGSHDEPQVLRGGPVDPIKLVVELAPMEIRTFIIELTITAPELQGKNSFFCSLTSEKYCNDLYMALLYR